MTEPGLCVLGAEINGHPAMDCRIEGGRITDMGTALRPAPRDHVLKADGGALITGLADHHVHLAALAAWRESLDFTGLRRNDIAAALRSAEPDASGWVRAVGYDDTDHGDLDRDVVDGWTAGVPTRIQHRSGALWILNSAALTLLAAETTTHPGIERDSNGRATGRIWRADDWLQQRLPDSPLSLHGIGYELACYGITHVSDATPDSGTAKLLADAVESGELPQHVATMSSVTPETRHPRLHTGPVKLIVADHELPDLTEFTERIRSAHAHGRPVAVHCITPHALAFALAALDSAGGETGDRIEHCAVADLATAGVLAHRRIRVVTQPTLVVRRGDSYRDRVDEADLPHLWRYATLLQAGVEVAPSSDAPYGDPNPWACLAAAVSRRTASGHILGAAERVTTDVALAGMQSPLDHPGGPPRAIHPAGPADLVLLDRPLSHALRDTDASCVRATIIDGTLAYERPA